MSLRKTRRDPEPGASLPEEIDGRAAPEVVVTGTGDARAHDGGTAVTGYRNQARGSSSSMFPGMVHISGTGEATASSGGIANTGYMVVNQLSAQFAPARVACSPRLVHLPERSRLFIGRSGEIAVLRDALAGTAVAQVVYGLGGIGKSALAIHYAETCEIQHNPVWWITAENQAAIDTGLAALATALQPALSAVLPQHVLREWAVQWLSAHDGWLIILDNVTDPADIRSLLARAATGRYLITSRRATGWHEISAQIRLDVLPLTEAVELFTKIFTHDRPRSTGEADALCDELGCLPLAIEQVASFCAETGTSPREYLDLLARYPAGMYAAAAESGDAGRAVARIWHMTLDRLSDDALTGEILRVLAWYASEDIPRSLLDGLAGSVAVRSATGRLAAHSMITVHDDGKVISVHRLVQAVARTPDRHDPHRSRDRIAAARTHATEALARILPDDARDPATWPTLRAYLPHAQALAGHTSPGTDTAATIWILDAAGLFMLEHGQVRPAIDFLQRALDSSCRMLGEDHIGSLVLLGNLGTAYSMAGSPGRSIPLLEQALTGSSRILGEDHPQVLRVRCNLAAAYSQAGNLARAISLYEQSVTDCVRIFGEDHPDMLRAAQFLAASYGMSGDASRAISLLEQLVADQTRILGKDHPHTLESRASLGEAHLSAGHAELAARLHDQTLADRTRILGKDHPETLASRDNLAHAYELMRDMDRAIPLYEQILADRTRVLGPDHPGTLSSRNNLALACNHAGDFERAVFIFEQVVPDLARVHGENHPDVLIARHNLANAYQSAGNNDRAVELLKQNLAESIRILGEGHPNTIQVRSDLGKAHAAKGDYEQAAEACEKALADRTRTSGKNHRDTLLLSITLAGIYLNGSQVPRAICLLEEILPDASKVLGENSLEVILACGTLGCAYIQVGDNERALSLAERVRGSLPLVERAIGGHTDLRQQ
jgi:tetratricopeptide (TPR) repeat protein